MGYAAHHAGQPDQLRGLCDPVAVVFPLRFTASRTDSVGLTVQRGTSGNSQIAVCCRESASYMKTPEHERGISTLMLGGFFVDVLTAKR